MGTFNGVASLLDEHDAKLLDVHMSLASADAEGTRWFGSVNDAEAVIDLNGRDVIIELPSGTRGRAHVEIDLTVDAPTVRLVGSGSSPV